MTKNLLLAMGLCCLSTVQQLYGQIRLPNIFSDHMVLQRESSVNIWGWGNAGASLKIYNSWNKDTISTKVDANGKWSAKVKTDKAGGPYRLSLESNGQQQTLHDILLGDVFICSGQSNMEWGGNQNLTEILDELPAANNPNIRLLQVNRNGSPSKQENISNNWQTLNASSLKPFSAIGYFIAKELNEKIQVPIGVINASWGGTPAEVWTDKQLIESDPELNRLAATQTANDYRPHENGVLWNAMIAPLIPYTIKGVFWYQGESNVGSWTGYNKLMKTMVTSWRNAWQIDFPFYFVQIAPFSYNNKIPLAAFQREQQAKTALELPNSGMAVITDLVDDVNNIHPTQKKEVAHRLSNLLRNDVYHTAIDNVRSPIFKDYKIDKNKVIISFHNLKGNLIIKGKQLTEIFIAGENRKFIPADAKVEKDKLIVSSKSIKNPIAVRFGFTETAMPNLFNEQSLPVSPFRTDNWDDQ